MSKRAFKYRLYPNETQRALLNQNYGHVRFVWNHCVEQFQQRQRPLSVTVLRGLHPFLQTVSAASLQQKQRDFAETKKQLFNKKRKKRIRAPRFKQKKHGGSFRLPYPKFRLGSSRIRLEKIGEVSYVADRPLPPNGQLLSVKCDWYGKRLVVADRFYASSKTCSGCGTKKATLSLAERTFECEKCSLRLDRDLNATLNLKQLAV